MTEAEIGALAAGGILGGMLATIGIILCVFYILLVIAEWKIFAKAGEAGWKSLIPIYNIYILYKICGLSFLKWFVLPVICGSFVLGFIAGLTGIQTISQLGTTIIDLIVAIKLINALGDAFGKGTGFKLGLFFLTNIFTLILGFGSAEYVGPADKD